MNADERERMYWLSKRIAEEQDINTFRLLVKELNDLYSQKEQRLLQKGQTE